MANVESKYLLDVTEVLNNLGLVSSAFKEVRQEFKDSSNDPFKEATKGAGDLEKELTGATKKMAEADALTVSLKDEIKKLNVEIEKQGRELKKVSAASKYKEGQTQVKALREELKKANDELRKMQKEGTKATSIMQRIKGGFLGAITGNMTGGSGATQTVGAILGAVNPALGVAAGLLGSLSEKAFAATANWQGYSVALKNSLGSQELANTNLAVLEDLAVRLPVGLNEITESFTQLVNRGFRPTRDELANLSGFASAQNKTFDQLIQAILDAETGELERLKEFGIKAEQQGGKVAITFRNIIKEFEKGSLDSATAFAKLAKELGSDALNADKMETLSGRISNLSDQSDRIARKFGEVLLPVFESVLSITGSILDKIDSSITGWTEFDKVVEKVGVTGGLTYPTLEKLFNLFNGNEEGRDRWKDFFFSLNAGFERLINYAELLVSLVDNISNPAGFAKAFARFGAQDSIIKQGIDDYYNTDPTKKKPGDFVYGPNGPTVKPGPTDAELKAAEARAKKLADLERKLADELLKIENEYGKEKLEALKDDELAYIEAKRKYDLLRIDQEQKALLRLKQLVSGAKKGMYDRSGNVVADTNATLSANEMEPFNFRRDLVNQQAYKDQAEFINNAEKQITEVISNEYQKQLQAAEYKYEELIKLARKAGIDTAKLEKEKAKEIARINTDKSLSDLEKQALQEQGDAELNIIRAQIEGRTGVEMEARKGLLEIEKKFILEKIKLIENSGDEEADARVRALKKQVGDIDLAIKELSDKEKDRKGIGKYLVDSLGMSQDDVDEALQAAQTFASSMQSIMSDLYSTLNRLSEQRIQRINDEISKKEDQVRTEQELNEQGVANNLSLRLKELADLKEARERAIEDQKRLQRTQLIVDTASQASSMITAASKVFAGFATIPIVGVGLGIAAVALMLGAFAAAKIKSFQLINQQTPQYGDGGEVDGKLHRDGGTLIEAEKGEYVINRNATSEHYDLIEAINQGDRAGIMDYLLSELLDGTGVSMNDADRRKEMRFISEYRKSSEEYGRETLDEMKLLRAEMVAIKSYTSRISRKQTTPLGSGKILEEDTLSGNKSIKDYTEMIE